ncbi:MAG: hypothetical protein AAF623_12685, partial [Planctomycetota bacterium]
MKAKTIPTRLLILVVGFGIAGSVALSCRQSFAQKEFEFRKQVEPGVVIYGMKNRFSDVGSVTGFDSSPDGRTLAFATAFGIKMFDLETDRVIETIDSDGAHFNHVRYSPDGRLLFAGGIGVNNQSVVRVFDAIINSPVKKIIAEPSSDPEKRFILRAIEVSTDGNYVAMLGVDSIQVWEVDSGDLVYQCRDLDFGGACFTPDEKRIVFPKDGKIEVIDIATGEPQTGTNFPVAGQAASQMSANISRNRLVAAHKNKLGVYLLDDQRIKDDDEALISIALPPGRDVQSATFSDDGQLIAAVTSNDKNATTMIVVDVEEKTTVVEFPIPSPINISARFSSNNRFLFVSGFGISGVKEIEIEEVRQNSETGSESLNQPSGPCNQFAIHPVEETFIAASSGGELCWFDMETGEVSRTLTKSNLATFEFNQSGSDILLVTSLDSESGIESFDFNTGESIRVYSIRQPVRKSQFFSMLRELLSSSDYAEPVEKLNYQLSLASCYSSDKESILQFLIDMGVIWETNNQGVISMTPIEPAVSVVRYETDSETFVQGKSIGLSQLGFTKNDIPRICAINPNGSQVAIGRSNELFLINPESGEVEIEAAVGDEKIIKLGYSSDGRFLAISTRTKQIVIQSDNGRQRFQVDVSFPMFA